MRTIFFLFAFLAVMIANSQIIIDLSETDIDTLDFNKQLTLKINAHPELGFNYPFFLYIPQGFVDNKNARLLVEPNNSGKATDDFSYHLYRAKQYFKKGNYIADSLKIPYLVPVFPRPGKNWEVYTHALDRDVMLLDKSDSLYRVDMQLAKMIDQARKILSKKGLNIKERVFMMGFSASGNFTNRFATLHPHLVRAVSSGAVNGLPIFPLDSISGELLPFPLGIGDIDELLGGEFNMDEYAKVSQLIYMGSFDRNDSYPYSDCFNDNEREIIKKHFGRTMMPDRWDKSQDILNEFKLPIQLVTYNGISHTITDLMKDDIIEFFRINNGEQCKMISPHEYPNIAYRYINEAHINHIYWKGDSLLPRFARELGGGHFAIGIEEYYTNQDYRQLKGFLRNSGFNFILKTDDVEIKITKDNFWGTSSGGDGEYQAFIVNLDEDDLSKIEVGKEYTLIPVNKSNKHYWTVNEGVYLKRE